MTYANRAELFDKTEWEGGLAEFIFGYGVGLEELPEGDTELREAFAEVLKAVPAFNRLEEMLIVAGEDE